MSKPIDKWEYNSEEPTHKLGKSGFQEESKLWKSMLNSFKLLFNDPYFDKQAQKIIKRFNDSRDSYKNIKGIGENGEVEKYDEENQLEKLERNQSKYRSDLTGMRDDLDKKNKIINRTKLPPSEKNKMETEIAMMEAKVGKLNEQMKRETVEKRKASYVQKINDLAILLDRKRTRYDQATMKEVDIKKLKANIYDIEEKMKKWEDKLEKTTEELESLYDRINQINETNEKAASVAENGFLSLVKFTAAALAEEYQDKVGERVNNANNQINWDVPMETLLDAYDRLKVLSEDDENTNPILGYLNRFKRDYETKEFSAGRELDKNVNITSIRDFNKLPFMVLSRIYASVRSSDKNPIPLDKLTTSKTDASSGELAKTLQKMSTNNEQNKAEWQNPNTKNYLKGLIDQLPIPPFSKQQFKKRVDRPWMVDRGFTPPALLALNIQDETKVKKESFDIYFEEILNEMAFDVDDYETDLIEVLTR